MATTRILVGEHDKLCYFMSSGDFLKCFECTWREMLFSFLVDGRASQLAGLCRKLTCTEV